MNNLLLFLHDQLGMNMATRERLIFSLVCLISFYSTESLALSSVTANTIKGNSPRFISSIESDIESNKAFNYFGVIYNGKSYFDTVDLNKVLGKNVLTKTPKTLGLSAAIKQPGSSEVIDSDGDGDIKLLEDPDTPISLEWYYEDASNKEVKLTDKQTQTTFETLVNSGIYPYVKVSGEIALTSNYGEPKSQTYPDSKIAVTKTPYRNFVVQVAGEAIKYASPHMLYSHGIYTWGDTAVFDPTDENGYVPQDNYFNNFPSVGANGLYFYLVTHGIDNSLNTTIWSVKTSNTNDGSPSAITAIVTKSEGPKAKNSIGGFKHYDAKNMVLVTLKGPDSSSKSSTQATAPKANLPVDIEVIGQTKQGVTLSYKFRINKWFINRGDIIDEFDKQNAWCDGLGDYRSATARELSNAKLISLPHNGNDMFNYKRSVHQGLITEWGGLSYFGGANFYNPTYGWTGTISPVTHNPIYVNINDAALEEGRDKHHHYYALCISK